jgi:hypothetical protein
MAMNMMSQPAHRSCPDDRAGHAKATELRGIEPADRQQDFQRDVPDGCLDEPNSVEPVVEPPDALNLCRDGSTFVGINMSANAT